MPRAAAPFAMAELPLDRLAAAVVERAAHVRGTMREA
jgi:hypothetical protein